MSEFQVDFRLLESARRIYILPAGPIDSEIFVSRQVAFMEALDRPWDYDRIADMTATEGHISHDQTQRLGAYWGTMQARIDRQVALAIVTHDTFTIARLELANLYFPKHELKAFATMADADAWLDARRRRMNGTRCGPDRYYDPRYRLCD